MKFSYCLDYPTDYDFEQVFVYCSPAETCSSHVGQPGYIRSTMNTIYRDVLLLLHIHQKQCISRLVLPSQLPFYTFFFLSPSSTRDPYTNLRLIHQGL